MEASKPVHLLVGIASGALGGFLMFCGIALAIAAQRNLPLAVGFCVILVGAGAYFLFLAWQLMAFSVRSRQPVAMQTESSTTVRPFVAAGALGVLTAVLASIALLVTFTPGDHAHAPPPRLLAGLAFLAPCVPLAYFAGRGFRRARRSAFQDLPQRACAIAAAFFVMLAVLLSMLDGSWALAPLPGLAALCFALCVRRFREAIRLLP